MEKLALGTQPLHDVDPLLAEIARVTASQVLGELLLHGTLQEARRGRGGKESFSAQGSSLGLSS